MNQYIGKNVLLTTSEWFTAPDGNNYKAVWGELKGVHEAGKTLGFIPNRSHANWFIEIGGMIIMGCQVKYLIQCNDKPNDERATNWTADAANGIKEYQSPCQIYFAK